MSAVVTAASFGNPDAIRPAQVGNAAYDRALSDDERRALWAARYYGGGHHRTTPAAGTTGPGNSTASAPQAGNGRTDNGGTP